MISADKFAGVVARLQEWIDFREGLSTIPVARMSWSTSRVEIFIGHVLVWSSEDGEPLSVDDCKGEYLCEIQNLARILQ